MTTCPKCQHEFEVETPTVADPVGMRGELFDSFYLLEKAIVEHVKATGSKVISSDDPRARMIGFETVEQDGPTARRWEIRLTTLITGVPNPVHRSYTRTVASRSKLAAIWSEGREPTEEFDRNDTSNAPVA